MGGLWESFGTVAQPQEVLKKVRVSNWFLSLVSYNSCHLRAKAVKLDNNAIGMAQRRAIRTVSVQVTLESSKALDKLKN